MLHYPENFENEVDILQVDESDDSYGVRMSDGWSISFGKDLFKETVPKVGDKIALRSLPGYSVAGLRLNGVVIFSRNDEEMEQERLSWIAESHERSKAKFEKSKDFLDAQYASLPDAFKKRIDKFRAEDPDFRWKDEAYEMFCCVEAVKIANALKTPEAIEEFVKLPYEKQKEIADIDDGHTGNTFGGACSMARAYLIKEELIHGSEQEVSEVDQGQCPSS